MSRGRYGKHGGQYVPETLMNEIIRLEEAYEHYKNDPVLMVHLRQEVSSSSFLFVVSLMKEQHRLAFSPSHQQVL